MPELIPLLNTIRIFSAITTHEKFFPNNPYMWKYMTMKNLIDSKMYNVNSKKNIISLGDSFVERMSVMNVSTTFNNVVTKSVKFSERSTIGDLNKQLNLSSKNMKYISEHDGNLDLQLTVKMTLPDNIQ